MRPKDCYIGVRPCGCVRAWVSFQTPRRELERAVSEFVRDGLQVESANTDEVRGRFGDGCDVCEPTRNQADLFA